MKKSCKVFMYIHFTYDIRTLYISFRYDKNCMYELNIIFIIIKKKIVIIFIICFIQVFTYVYA